ncbi:IS5/IS1182 family transposase, partial [Burkholderia sp. SIMBA_052]
LDQAHAKAYTLPLPPDELVNTAAPDSAYDMRRCHGAVIERGANGIIPIRRNGRAWEADCPAAIARNEILYATRNLTRRSGRSARYHVRG